MSKHQSNRRSPRAALQMKFEHLESRLMMAADFGDAPIPYPTTLAENGARHEAVGPQLGATRDTEADGAHSASAAGDGFDEDGVLIGAMRAGQLDALATVTVQSAPAGAKLDAWIDFDGDGNWGGDGEQVANSVAVVEGANQIHFDVPSTAIAGTAFARFRLSTAGNLGAKGAAADGEVEDYAAIIAPPVAASGNFAAARNVATGLTAAQYAIAVDLNRDGEMDVLSAAYGIDQIAWHRQAANGTFTTIPVSTSANGASGVAAADFDGDGDLDVVSASQLDNKIVWYENLINLSFVEHVLSTTATQAAAVRTADLDGDGDMDIVSSVSNRIQWYENNGSASFTVRLLPITGAGTFGPAVSDIDGDGDLDIAFNSFSSTATGNQIGWLENNGSQVFSIHVITTALLGARRVVAADLDRDGDVDLVGASSGDNTIAWYENDGNQAFTKRTISTEAIGALDVFVADVNGDGRLDVATASSTANQSKLAWYQNNGGQTFTARTITTGTTTSARSIFMADIDDDGDLDALSAQAGNARVTWFENLAIVPGDYDTSGLVDGGDFLLWQRSFGGPADPQGSGADGVADGTINGADLTYWGSRFGNSSATASSSDSAAAALTIADEDLGSGASSVAAESIDTPVGLANSLAAVRLAQVDAALAEWATLGRHGRRRARPSFSPGK